MGSYPGRIAPGATLHRTVRLWDFVHRFNVGERIALIITSDGFPSFARNLGYGDPPATAVRMRAQRNVIFHHSPQNSKLRFYRLSEDAELR